jgi:CPA2 family monovalent cation:H+ antiporter-2
MGINTVVYSILTMAVIALMFAFVQPLLTDFIFQSPLNVQQSPFTLRHIIFNTVIGLLTILMISPFLRAMVMKKNRSEEWKQLWQESNRNRLPLLFTILVRVMIAVAFIFYICNYLSRFSNALMITLGVVVVALIIVSRTIKRRSILLERLFINNLRSRDIEAQIQGKKRPLYEGKLLDRDIHIAEFTVPANSQWMGRTLKNLNLGQKYGVHVSSILRGGCRLNIPDGDYPLYPYDRLQVIGSDDQMATFAHALQTEVIAEDPDLEQRQMKLRQLIISADSPFVGKTLVESGIRSRYSCMVVGIEEGKENLSPVRPNRRFQEGDILWIVGEEESLNAITTA